MWYVPNISAANKNMMISVPGQVLEEQKEREIGWKERGRPCKEMWVSQENSVSHRKFLALQGKKHFKTKGQYCAGIHIPNELHSSNLFSEPQGMESICYNFRMFTAHS
jgi:hypothetical protein